ncbi:tyrosine-type recombinase/integrase [Pseudogracilibacillus auburnensis]|nr:tyrosine-type recombinase/integrase [Pseudogracilibacillus auburnensis]
MGINGKQIDKEKDYIFITEENELCSQEVLTFNSVCKHLEKKNIPIKRITPHGLRHTHATVLINNGIPPQTVADRLGNSVEMVYKVYAHSFKDLEEKAVSVFSENIQIGAITGAD